MALPPTPLGGMALQHVTWGSPDAGQQQAAAGAAAASLAPGRGLAGIAEAGGGTGSAGEADDEDASHVAVLEEELDAGAYAQYAQ